MLAYAVRVYCIFIACLPKVKVKFARAKPLSPSGGDDLADSSTISHASDTGGSYSITNTLSVRWVLYRKCLRATAGTKLYCSKDRQRNAGFSPKVSLVDISHDIDVAYQSVCPSVRPYEKVKYFSSSGRGLILLLEIKRPVL